MKAAVLIFALALGTTLASTAEPDLGAALEARYGPFPGNVAVQVDVKSRQAYADGDKFKEDGLPDGFLAVVWDRSNSRFAALVKNEEGKAVRISGTASLKADIPVLLRRIAAGETVGSDDVAVRSIRVASVEGYAERASDVIGKQASKPISPGQPILSASLAVPPAVTRNSEVTVVFRKGTLELAAKGKSLGDAAIGETVKVMRPSASKVLEGMAVAEGVVLVSEGIKP